jgi:hypothetical protein
MKSVASRAERGRRDNHSGVRECAEALQSAVVGLARLFRVSLNGSVPKNIRSPFTRTS